MREDLCLVPVPLLLTELRSFRFVSRAQITKYSNWFQSLQQLPIRFCFAKRRAGPAFNIDVQIIQRDRKPHQFLFSLVFLWCNGGPRRKHFTCRCVICPTAHISKANGLAGIIYHRHIGGGMTITTKAWTSRGK